MSINGAFYSLVSRLYLYPIHAKTLQSFGDALPIIVSCEVVRIVCHNYCTLWTTCTSQARQHRRVRRARHYQPFTSRAHLCIQATYTYTEIAAAIAQHSFAVRSPILLRNADDTAGLSAACIASLLGLLVVSATQVVLSLVDNERSTHHAVLSDERDEVVADVNHGVLTVLSLQVAQVAHMPRGVLRPTMRHTGRVEV